MKADQPGYEQQEDNEDSEDDPHLKKDASTYSKAGFNRKINTFPF